MSMINILVYDSGLGGLSYLAYLRNALSHYSAQIQWYYFLDNKNFPYGEKTQNELISYVHHWISAFMQHMQIDVIVFACNTISAVCLPVIRNQYSCSFIGTALLPLLQNAQEQYAVIATKMTIRIVQQHHSNKHILYATPLIISAVEAQDDELLSAAIIEELQGVKEACYKQGISSLVLGCTHFLHAYPSIAQYMGPSIMLLDTRHIVFSQLWVHIWNNTALDTTEKIDTVLVYSSSALSHQHKKLISDTILYQYIGIIE